jgi:hypothetical protein
LQQAAKSVEGTLQTAGDLLLYKIDYTYQNGAGFRISEAIPAGFTVNSYGPTAIPGGSVTPGNPTVWNFPTMAGQPGQKSGSVWVLLAWDGVGAGPFTNTATGSWAGSGAVTSSVTTEVGDAAIKITKSQSMDQVMLNSNITYYLLTTRPVYIRVVLRRPAGSLWLNQGSTARGQLRIPAAQAVNT